MGSESLGNYQEGYADAREYLQTLTRDRYYAKAVYFPTWWYWISSQAFESHLETFGSGTRASRASDGTHSGAEFQHLPVMPEFHFQTFRDGIQKLENTEQVESATRRHHRDVESGQQPYGCSV